MSAVSTLPHLGELVTSRALAGRGTYVLAAYCAVGESRRAVLLPAQHAGALADGLPPAAVDCVLVSPSSLEPSPWAVAGPARKT